MPTESVHWIALPAHADHRGTLTSIECGRDIPFAVQRVFYMHHMRCDRGGHAHRDTDQVVIAAAGRFTLTLSDRNGSRDYRLDDPDCGLYVPRMTFIDIHAISTDAVCLVLASTHYDMDRSLRSREAWQQQLARQD